MWLVSDLFSNDFFFTTMTTSLVFIKKYCIQRALAWFLISFWLFFFQHFYCSFSFLLLSEYNQSQSGKQKASRSLLLCEWLRMWMHFCCCRWRCWWWQRVTDGRWLVLAPNAFIALWMQSWSGVAWGVEHQQIESNKKRNEFPRFFVAICVVS